VHHFVQFPESTRHENWTPSLIYVARIPHGIMPLFPDIINRAGVSFHVFWWKVTINQTCFWNDCKTSMKLYSQSKNVLVECLWLRHVGAAKQTSFPHRCSFPRHIATHFLPKGLQDMESASPGTSNAALHSASTVALLSSKRITGAGNEEVCFSF